MILRLLLRFMMRVEHDSDIVGYITKFAEENGIEPGSFTAIGALKNAKLGFYDQEHHEYREIEIDSPSEVVSCSSNISLKDGRPFVYAHAALSDKNGGVQAGYLIKGTVFAAEVHLQELKGAKFERKYDEITGLSLWSIEG